MMDWFFASAYSNSKVASGGVGGVVVRVRRRTGTPGLRGSIAAGGGSLKILRTIFDVVHAEDTLLVLEKLVFGHFWGFGAKIYSLFWKIFLGCYWISNSYKI